jgi:hypothetical protein
MYDKFIVSVFENIIHLRKDKKLNYYKILVLINVIKMFVNLSNYKIY